MPSAEIELFLYFLKNICIGSLVSGLIIFFLTLIFQGSNLFGHDTDIDHGGVDLGHADIDLDADVDLDLDVDTDISIGIDKDIHLGVDKDIDFHDSDIGADTPTPLMLLMGTFMITFGGVGTLILDIDTSVNPLILIFMILVSPIITTIVVSKIWGKIAVSEIYDTPLDTIKIDDPVKTITTVDTQGGLVVIDTSSIHGPVKMAAKTRYGAISKAMPAFVIEILTNTLIIDEWPSSHDKEKPLPKQESLKWE